MALKLIFIHEVNNGMFACWKMLEHQETNGFHTDQQIFEDNLHIV